MNKFTLKSIADSTRPASRWGITFRLILRAFRVISTRLRFLAAFVLIFLIVGKWETLRTYWARLTTSGNVENVVSTGTEFFCPMDPGVLSDWPSKCPICNMTLVRRKRGDTAPLPDGVVARMQFTPYRLSLGGIRTVGVEYAALALTVELPGRVTKSVGNRTQIEAECFASEQAWIEVGQTGDIALLRDQVASSLKGIVRELTPSANSADSAGKVVIDFANSPGLRLGDRVRVILRSPIERVEPFRSLPSTPPPLAAGEPRRLYSCMEHPEVVRDAPGRCPEDQTELMAKKLRANQRIRWWCPMHPTVTANSAGAACQDCGGMVLIPRLISYRLPGTVLAVPVTAVIDDGSRSLIYVDRGAGMFDAKVVVLGPRSGDQFAVVSGLEPGDLVAAQGAFLIDAETRLNPGLAVGYFGSRDRTSAKDERVNSNAWLDEIPSAVRPLALEQKLCPVTGKPLGSMGAPIKLSVQGRILFICCDGCVAAIQGNPDRYLKKLSPKHVEGHP